MPDFLETVGGLNPAAVRLAVSMGAHGLREYAYRLRASGFAIDDIRRMMQANPARLLLEPRGEPRASEERS